MVWCVVCQVNKALRSGMLETIPAAIDSQAFAMTPPAKPDVLNQVTLSCPKSVMMQSRVTSGRYKKVESKAAIAHPTARGQSTRRAWIITGLVPELRVLCS